MSCCVALNIDCNGKTCDMAGMNVYFHRKASLRSAKAHCANARIVDKRQKVFFELVCDRIAAFVVDFTEKRFFRKEGALFKVTADTYANNERRTGFTTRVEYRINHKFLNPFNTVCGNKHFNERHIFAAATLGRNVNFENVAGHHFNMHDSGRVVFGVHSVKRMTNDGFSQISFGVSASNASVYRFVDIAFEINFRTDG